MRGVKKIGVISLKFIAWTIILLIPLVGVWTSSSMAAFANSVPWLAVTAGLLAFPVLPVVWELGAALHRRRKVARGIGDQLAQRALTRRHGRILGRLYPHRTQAEGQCHHHTPNKSSHPLSSLSE